MNTDFLAIPDWFSYENAGAGIAVADLNADGFPDLVVLQVDDPAGASSAYFRVGFGTDDQLTIGQWTAWSPVPDWDSWFNEGAGVAIADISGNGRPDLLVFRVDAVPNGQNAGYYRIGWDIDAAGQVTGWSPWLAVPDWFPWFNAGADVTVADVDGDGVLDLVVLMVDSPAGRNQGYYRSCPLNADGFACPERKSRPKRLFRRRLRLAGDKLKKAPGSVSCRNQPNFLVVVLLEPTSNGGRHD